MALPDLSLSRSRLDKVSQDRQAEGLLARTLQDPTTSLLLLRDGRCPVHPDGPGRGLRTLRGAEAAAVVAALGGAERLAAGGEDPATEVVAVHLGLLPADDERAPGAVVGLLLPAEGAGPAVEAVAAGPAAGTADPVVEAALAEPAADLRALGTLLPATDAGALTEAVALHHWHRSHPRCPRCGSATRPAAAGHERVCLTDGSTQHPRHDPAVIMTVTDPAGRLLLGHQGRWPAGRFSAFAGFVEPGESLEGAVARELLEEAGVRVREVAYLGSQPWPFPASLMLAFHAETDDTTAVADGDEITEVRWFDRPGLVAAVATGEVTVPPAVSVARRLIEDWLGEPLEQQADWR
ncbi:NAD(+) diphosphatase [Jannaschia sp. R86511]|uniref:NAD(+) diphosphatase n=1 Tax=Jannaschia sp. R86511 TaxID=3093853 RepID=UPI0036D38296